MRPEQVEPFRATLHNVITSATMAADAAELQARELRDDPGRVPGILAADDAREPLIALLKRAERALERYAAGFSTLRAEFVKGSRVV